MRAELEPRVTSSPSFVSFFFIRRITRFLVSYFKSPFSKICPNIFGKLHNTGHCMFFLNLRDSTFSFML